MTTQQPSLESLPSREELQHRIAEAYAILNIVRDNYNILRALEERVKNLEEALNLYEKGGKAVSSNSSASNGLFEVAKTIPFTEDAGKAEAGRINWLNSKLAELKASGKLDYQLKRLDRGIEVYVKVSPQADKKLQDHVTRWINWVISPPQNGQR
ncbi:MAG: hypothetical protein QXJ17_04540 [Nitrososphaeria archaeon]